MKYEFEIRAIIGAQQEGDSIYFNYTTTASPSATPTLGSMNQGSTTVNITWNLQSYSENRCPITSLIADGSPNFYDVFPVVDSSLRQPYSMIIRHLRPSTIYLCRIYVVNSAGNSSALAIAIQTQPSDYRSFSINLTDNYSKY
ncbi:hypothetical protein NQ314_021009 [Rhamnusium bicolor]|uniref:Fibronectin type-III domain-containing protein n=1 Tax=Rhamnusium bicolor TaxID=1586634 RepID=A0AAV8WK56_9CUCU|nr:hypothetical protein NQ314_021009 [Rhamnusium bicolor]